MSIADFRRVELKWLRTFLEHPSGIPSHGTFGRVSFVINPVRFQQCFVAWIQSVAQAMEEQGVAIYGKTVRRSLDSKSNSGGI